MTEYTADTKSYVCEKQFNNVVKCSLLGRKKGMIKTPNVVFHRDKEKEKGKDKWRNKYRKETYQNQNNAYLQEIV